MPRGLRLLAALALAAALAGVSQAAQAPAGEEEVAVPAPVMKVEVKDGLLSVELAGAAFGDVIKAVASRSGIQATVTGDVSGRPVTTKFRGMELEDGIMRLLSLVQERNFFFSYDGKGGLKRIEIYGAAAPAAPKGKDRPAPKAAQTERPASSPRAPSASTANPLVRKNPPAAQRIIRSPRNGAAGVQPKEEDAEVPEQPGGNAGEETPSGPPAVKAPPYIPPPPLNP